MVSAQNMERISAMLFGCSRPRSCLSAALVCASHCVSHSKRTSSIASAASVRSWRAHRFRVAAGHAAQTAHGSRWQCAVTASAAVCSFRLLCPLFAALIASCFRQPDRPRVVALRCCSFALRFGARRAESVCSQTMAAGPTAAPSADIIAALHRRFCTDATSQCVHRASQTGRSRNQRPVNCLSFQRRASLRHCESVSRSRRCRSR